MTILRAVPRWSLAMLWTAATVAISVFVSSVYSASGDSHDVAYHACLFNGALSQVGTTQPANCGRGTPISWTSATPPPSLIFTIHEETVEVGPDMPGLAIVECGAGEIATGGGYFSNTLDVSVYENLPYVGSQSDLPTGWRAASWNQNQNFATSLTVYAICMSVDD